MFTGIVEDVLEYTVNGNVLTMEYCSFFEGTVVGDSISVNGTCLTIDSITDKDVTFRISKETKSLTNIVYKNIANVEKAMTFGVDRVGGHMVSGHVHGVGYLENIVIKDDEYSVYFKIYSGINELDSFITYKNSIAIDGISLTIAEISKENDYYLIKTCIIPHTWNNTNISLLKTGDLVNIELNKQDEHIQPGSKSINLDDNYFMKLALDEALSGKILNIAPNPQVGAVIVDPSTGEIIAVGHHSEFGGPHAEVVAIDKVPKKERKKKLTLYTTLEPCCHYGKQGPCCEYIVKSKIIKRVVIGITDPDPLVNGGGIEFLRKAGIEVVTGVLDSVIKQFMERYIYSRKTKKSYVIAKVGLSSDGVYCVSGVDTNITSEHARNHSMYLRTINQCIIVGNNTLRVDKPLLNIRIDDYIGKHPTVVIIDFDQSIHPKVLQSYSNLIVFTSQTFDIGTVVGKNQNVVKLPKEEQTLKAVVSKLYQMGYIYILVEGGGKIHDSFHRNGLINEIQVYRSSKSIGPVGINWSVPLEQYNLIYSAVVDSSTTLSIYNKPLPKVNFVDKNNGTDSVDWSMNELVDWFKDGGMVIVMDSSDRENEADLVVNGNLVTEEQLIQMQNLTTGITCCVIDQQRADLFGLKPMVEKNTDNHQTAFTVSFDSSECHTGISAEDKIKSIIAICSDNHLDGGIRTPGHMFPLIARPGGLSERKGHTEAVYDLCRLANVEPRVGIISELINRNGKTSSRDQSRNLARLMQIPFVDISTIYEYSVENKLYR